MLDGIFGFIAIACGLYCLYAFYLLKVKKEISAYIFLPKDAQYKKCKDKDAYCKEVGPPVLVLGIVVLIYGGVDMYNSYVGGLGTVFLITFLIVPVVLVWFFLVVRKCNKKYFDI